MTRLVAALAALIIVVLGAPTALAQEGQVDLAVTATLDRTAYLPGDVVTMNVLVMNNGPTAATGVVVHSTGDLAFTGWGKLAETGIDLAPGEQVELSVTAPPNDTGAGMAAHLEVVSAEPDTDPTNNRASVDTFVTVDKGDLTLTVYGDADGDGAVDPGETWAGLLVTLQGGLRYETHQARAGADGVVRFTGISGGEYAVRAGLPADWYLDSGAQVRLRADQNDSALAAQHVDLTKLHATVALDRPGYTVGDPVRERITLTNTAATDFTAVVAQCGSYTIDFGENNELHSKGWAELDPDGPGAVVRSGETRTWEFTDVVTPLMWKYGFVLLQCDFRLPGMTEGAFAAARAVVPGGRGAFGGTLLTEGRPAPDLKLLLINRATGERVARTVSDASGGFEFPQVPADVYELRPLGPWRMADQHMTVQVLADEQVRYDSLEVLPGPFQQDPDAVNTPVTPATVAAPYPEELANTGGGAAELTALGVLLVVAGLFARRVCA
ncbi:hypothetical protein [Actinophytocola sp.]|uniref:hypothetical protein n=1 Tax=Actinophytocola sp. TaxID=1872138 RepID=UPI00389AB3A7